MCLQLSPSRWRVSDRRATPRNGRRGGAERRGVESIAAAGHADARASAGAGAEHCGSEDARQRHAVPATLTPAAATRPDTWCRSGNRGHVVT